MSTLTPSQRDKLLDRAVQAMTEWLACGPTTSPHVTAERSRRAGEAVTAAVTTGDHIHTLISAKARCSGLWVIDQILNPRARSRALAIERNAATNYLQLIGEAQRSTAARRYGNEGYGAATQIAADLGISRKTLYNWLEDKDVPVKREPGETAHV